MGKEKQQDVFERRRARGSVRAESQCVRTTSKIMAVKCTTQKNTEAIADSFKPSTHKQAKKATIIKAEISMSLPGQHDFKYDMADTADTTHVVA
jgi:hypothetical protein